MRSIRAGNIAVLAGWLAVVAFLVSQHVMWRDEVRALTLAIAGDDVVAMLRRLHGEGHPALWYLLLRAAHGVIGMAALPAVALAVGVAAAALLALTSNIRWWVLALILFGQMFLYEYTVMARNYGLSMLLLFGLALVVRRNPASLWIGVLLFLLVNVNVHSVVIAAAFLLFLLIELLRPVPVARAAGVRPEVRNWLINTIVAAAGVACCVATIFPTFNDAAAHSGIPAIGRLAGAVILPQPFFPELFPAFLDAVPPRVLKLLGSMLLFLGTLGLVRSLAAWIASLAALVGLTLLFAIVYGGFYRHEALFLATLIALYWIAADPRFRWAYPARLDRVVERVRPVGIAAVLLLFALQLPPAFDRIRSAVAGLPESRSASLGAYVAAHPEYRQSWMVAAPDALVEALPYYLANPTYLLHLQRADSFIVYTRHARLDVRLATLLDTARDLQRRSGHPTLILLGMKLTPATVGAFHEAYVWQLSVPPGDAQQFLSATRFLGHFRPARSDEEFDLYEVR